MAASDNLRAFLAEQGNLIVAGIRENGAPHLTPTWFYWDGERFTSRLHVAGRSTPLPPRPDNEIAGGPLGALTGITSVPGVCRFSLWDSCGDRPPCHGKVLTALCDIVDCTPADLIDPYAEAAARRKTAGEPVAALVELKPGPWPERARVLDEE